ncbi:MAG: DUF6033 family protein [Lachnospiraceae bacterium]
MGTDAVNQVSQTQVYEQSSNTGVTAGKTIGEPKLSEKAQKYYESLQKKYGNMDFILVSKDMKETAQAQAGKYANPNRMVVLIDEEKIERMATDEAYRKKYEGIISGATAQLEQMKESIISSGANVKTYGVQINDGGNTSFFAVIDKSLADQRKRIEAKAEKKAEEKKKAAKEENAERLERQREKNKPDKVSDKTDEELVTVTASSIEELIKKINDTVYAAMSDTTETEAEKKIGRSIDYTV